MSQQPLIFVTIEDAPETLRQAANTPVTLSALALCELLAKAEKRGEDRARERTSASSGAGRLLTRKQLAAALEISLGTLDRLELPSVRVGAHRRFDLAQVRAHLASAGEG